MCQIRQRFQSSLSQADNEVGPTTSNVVAQMVELLEQKVHLTSLCLSYFGNNTNKNKYGNVYSLIQKNMQDKLAMQQQADPVCCIALAASCFSCIHAACCSCVSLASRMSAACLCKPIVWCGLFASVGRSWVAVLLLFVASPFVAAAAASPWVSPRSIQLIRHRVNSLSGRWWF